MTSKKELLLLFPFLENSTEMYRKDGYVNPRFIKRHPKLEAYCIEEVKRHPEYVKPTFYLHCLMKDITLTKCCVCGKPIPYPRHATECKTCSIECSHSPAFYKLKHETIVASNMKKYGVKNPAVLPEAVAKRKKTCLEKYGYEYASQRKEHKEKLKATFLEKYGTTCSLHNPEVRAKMLKKMEEKYGVGATPESVAGKNSGEGERRKKVRYEKIVEYCKEHNITPMFEYSEYKGLFNGTAFHRYPFKCNVCGNEWEWYLYKKQPIVCRMCHPKDFNVSGPENEIAAFIQSLGFTLQRNSRHIIPPYELDMYIPSCDVAIEHNGVYYHREGRKTFHQKKRELCEQKGLTLIQIFEDEWMHKRLATKAKLKEILGKSDYVISQDACSVQPIQEDVARNFISKYSLKGWLDSTIHYGVFYKSRLVSVAAFKKDSQNLREYDFVDYCTLYHFSVENGSKTALDAFMGDYGRSVVARADKRWLDEKFYKNMGFSHLEDTPPVFWFCKKDYRFAQNVSPEQIPSKLFWSYDTTLSLEENMLKNKFFRVWDCGSSVWVIR